MEKSASYNHRKLKHSFGEREQKQKKREKKEKSESHSRYKGWRV